jgi:hypothetical protein
MKREGSALNANAATTMSERTTAKRQKAELESAIKIISHINRISSQRDDKA